MALLEKGLIYIPIIAMLVILTLLSIKMIRHHKGGVFKQHSKDYLIYIIVLITTIISVVIINNETAQNKIDDQKQAEQIKAEYAPHSKTLTEKSISKTFTYDFDLKGYDGDQANVNKQVNRYLNSISNLNDYQLKITTQQEKRSFFGASHPYSQTVQLTKKID